MPINTYSESTFSELISSFHADPDKFVFFVGAGLSQPLFPSWASLLTELVRSAVDSGLPYSVEELLQYIDRGENYSEIAEACVASLGAARYRDALEKVFDKDFSLADIPESYQLLMGLSPKVIVTTNYDRVPDVAGGGVYRVGVPKTAAETLRALASGKRVVFKLHGDISDQSSIILTSSDYQSIIFSDPSTRTLLNSLLSTKIFIFLGFSLSDPHVAYVLDGLKSIGGGIPLSHYVLLNETSRFKVSAFESRYGVKVISYVPAGGDHPEVAHLLRSLSNFPSSEDQPVALSKKKSFDTVTGLLEALSGILKSLFPSGGVSVFVVSEQVHISFYPVGQTAGEVQAELLSMFRCFDFECNVVDCVYVTLYARGRDNFVVDGNQKALICLCLSFSLLHSYACKEIAVSTLWSEIAFYQPGSISNVFQAAQEVSFPLHLGVMESFK